jgi:hypothetical protein
MAERDASFEYDAWLCQMICALRMELLQNNTG